MMNEKILCELEELGKVKPSKWAIVDAYSDTVEEDADAWCKLFDGDEDGGLREIGQMDRPLHAYQASFLRNHVGEACEEIRRLQAEIVELKKTSVEITKPDGTVAYFRVYCQYGEQPHTHDGVGITVQVPGIGDQLPEKTVIQGWVDGPTPGGQGWGGVGGIKCG